MIVRLLLFLCFGVIAGLLFGVDAAFVTSRALSDALILVGSVFAFSAVMTLLRRGT